MDRKSVEMEFNVETLNRKNRYNIYVCALWPSMLEKDIIRTNKKTVILVAHYFRIIG
jgi:hypothetical protein